MSDEAGERLPGGCEGVEPCAEPYERSACLREAVGVDGHEPVDRSGQFGGPLWHCEAGGGPEVGDLRPGVALLVPVQTGGAHQDAAQQHGELAPSQRGGGRKAE